ARVPCMTCDGRRPIMDAPTFTVEGSHQPRLTGGTSPAIVSLGTSPYTIKGRLTDSATGLPLAGATVVLGLDSACAEGVSGTFRTVTGSTGYYAFPPLTSNDAKMYSNCIWVPGRDWGGRNSRVIYVTGRTIPVLLRTWVSAAPAATRVAVGTTVAITGSVGGPPYDCPIALQRLYGSTAWRTVDTGIVRMSGRYTLHARPSVVGANRYRVLLPRCYDWVTVATGQRIIFGT
ncbi:MAG TPA: hypothetical protein VIR16_10525, partial [Candidatus Limnocylindrales bacterium]